MKSALPDLALIPRTIANTPGSASEYLAFPDRIRCPGQTL